jgi:hypothetical protein
MPFHIILTIKISYFPKRHSHIILCYAWNASLYKISIKIIYLQIERQTRFLVQMTSQDVHDFMDSHFVLSNSSREFQTDGQSVNYRVIRT